MVRGTAHVARSVEDVAEDSSNRNSSTTATFAHRDEGNGAAWKTFVFADLCKDTLSIAKELGERSIISNLAQRINVLATVPISVRSVCEHFCFHNRVEWRHGFEPAANNRIQLFNHVGPTSTGTLRREHSNHTSKPQWTLCCRVRCSQDGGPT